MLTAPDSNCTTEIRILAVQYGLGVWECPQHCQSEFPVVKFEFGGLEMLPALLDLNFTTNS